MTRAARGRMALSMAGLAALSLGIYFSPTLGGLAIGLVLALGLSALGLRVFRRLASREELRTDLEDRTRHPP